MRENVQETERNTAGCVYVCVWGDMEGVERDRVTLFSSGEESGDRAGNAKWLSEGMCCEG